MTRTILSIAFLGAFSTAALAQFSGTPEDQAACRSDARRLCRSVQQDEPSVLKCLIERRNKLSRACRTVLQRNGQLS